MDWMTDPIYRNLDIYWQSMNFWMQFLLTSGTLAVLVFSYRSIKLSEKSLELSRESLNYARKTFEEEYIPKLKILLDSNFSIDEERLKLIINNKITFTNLGNTIIKIVEYRVKTIKNGEKVIDHELEEILWNFNQEIELPPNFSINFSIPLSINYEINSNILNARSMADMEFTLSEDFFSKQFVVTASDIKGNEFELESPYRYEDHKLFGRVESWLLRLKEVQWAKDKEKELLNSSDMNG